MSFSDGKKDYHLTTVRVMVDGGARRLQPTVLLRPGRVDPGTVTDGDADPLGSITVSITVKGVERKIAHPPPEISGPSNSTICRRRLRTCSPSAARATPRTRSRSGSLRAPEKKPLTVPLAKGSGTINGLLTDATGAGLGGATVTVGGGANPVTTTTLTQGTVGSTPWPAFPPRTYTVTFS